MFLNVRVCVSLYVCEEGHPDEGLCVCGYVCEPSVCMKIKTYVPFMCESPSVCVCVWQDNRASVRAKLESEAKNSGASFTAAQVTTEYSYVYIYIRECV